MIDCDKVRQFGSVSLVESCDRLSNGSLRLLTPFHYPNGSSIDLFLEVKEPLFGSFVLSDLGNTISYLLDLQVRPWSTQKRRQVVEDICRAHHVEWSRGRFQVLLDGDDYAEIPAAMVRLAEACIRVSDLAFHARLWSVGSFAEEMEEFLSALDLRYEKDVVELGRDNQEVKLDFRVFGDSQESLVQTLSSANKASAQNVANSAFVRWWDLGRSRKSAVQTVTVIDESNNVFRESDVSRLEQFSTVFWFPGAQQQLSEFLAS